MPPNRRNQNDQPDTPEQPTDQDVPPAPQTDPGGESPGNEPAEQTADPGGNPPENPSPETTDPVHTHRVRVVRPTASFQVEEGLVLTNAWRAVTEEERSRIEQAAVANRVRLRIEPVS